MNDDGGGSAAVLEEDPTLGVDGELGMGVKEEKGGEGGVSGGEVRWERGS